MRLGKLDLYSDIRAEEFRLDDQVSVRGLCRLNQPALGFRHLLTRIVNWTPMSRREFNK